MQLQDGFFHQSYYGQTLLDPVGAVAVGTLGVLTFVLPRRLALFPFLALICFVPCTQRVAIAGLDFNLMRILLIFGWSRMIARGELQALQLIKLDRLVLAWAAVETVIYVLQYRNGGAIVTMAGRMGEALGGYFIVRCFIRDWRDLKLLCVVIAAIAIPTAITFGIEKVTARNLFSIFGGVPEITMMREGKLRATGALGNPILAGCYWASLVPMAGALLWCKGTRLLGVLGVAGGVVVVFAVASSTPLAALMAAFLGAFLFRYRYKLQDIRKAVVYTTLALHVVMTLRGKPVWHLLARIDLVGGSTGYHRYALIDAWIHRIPEWGLLGVKGTAHWGWGLADITNQYVLESVRGGLATLVIFVWLIYTAFWYQGQVWRDADPDKERLALAWALGTSLFTHCCSFIAVSYFGQMNFSWYMQLALLASMFQHVTENASETSEAAEVAVRPEGLEPRRARRRLLGAT